jgi:hypothetical protein
MSEIDEILDGLALWNEHKPQTGEDWIAVAERFIAAGEDTYAKASPLFAAVVIAVSRLDSLIKGLEEEEQLQREEAAEFRDKAAKRKQAAIRKARSHRGCTARRLRRPPQHAHRGGT